MVLALSLGQSPFLAGLLELHPPLTCVELVHDLLGDLLQRLRARAGARRVGRGEVRQSEE